MAAATQIFVVITVKRQVLLTRADVKSPWSLPSQPIDQVSVLNSAATILTQQLHLESHHLQSDLRIDDGVVTPEGELNLYLTAPLRNACIKRAVKLDLIELFSVDELSHSPLHIVPSTQRMLMNISTFWVGTVLKGFQTNIAGASRRVCFARVTKVNKHSYSLHELKAENAESQKNHSSTWGIIQRKVPTQVLTGEYFCAKKTGPTSLSSSAYAWEVYRPDEEYFDSLDSGD